MLQSIYNDNIMDNIFIPVSFFPHSDIVVVGHNPEMADANNPRGERYGQAHYVYAEDKDGNRLRKLVTTSESRHTDTNAAQKAKATADALTIRLQSGKLPTGLSTWSETHPAYGSSAYEYGSAEEAVLERTYPDRF